MDFWSKGLGKRTVSLRLSDGEAIKSGDRLYVRGTTEEPVVWDYIMPLQGDDLVEVVGLLGDRRVVEYLYRSPDRWRLYGSLVLGGARFLVLLLKYMIIGKRKPAPEEPTIQVPPPSDRRRRRLGGARTGAARSRLGQSRVTKAASEPADVTE